MRRIFTLIALAVGALALTSGSAFASPDRGTTVRSTPLSFAVDPLQEELQIDAMSTSSDPGTQHVGPVSSTSADSGTCGNDWAQDSFDRFFTIRQTGPGTYTVYEQFKNGAFVTTGTVASPGACDASDGYGPGVLTSGLTGTMHGYLIINVTCLTLGPCENSTASCSSGCGTTDSFVTQFFPGATYTTDTFFFHYAGYDGTNSALLVHEWKNASCNRGGNHGDIATAATTGVDTSTCF